MNDDDLLRDSLRQIGDQAEPVDFVDRSLSRSKRIGRNRRLISGAAMVAVLGLAGGLTWQLGPPWTNQSTPAVNPSAAPSAVDPPPPSLSPSPTASPSSTQPVAESITGPFYYADSDRLVRVNESDVDTVLDAGAYSANVSPDGAHIAFVDGNGNVVVSDRDGGQRRTLSRGSIGAGYEPAWSPDSKRLLVAKGAAGEVTMGIVTVASGRFTALPHQPAHAIHYLWSGDGQHLGYATGTCEIGVADADGGNARIVPVFGDLDKAVNPKQRRSCDPYSISPDGGLIAVNQRTGDQPDGDIGRDLFANALIDTRTGQNVTLPVTGGITAILFEPDGDLLVRTSNRRLTLLAPDHTIKARVTEPAAVSGFNLLAHTPN
jgi:TolB protein